MKIERPYTLFEENGSSVCVGIAVDNLWLPASCAEKVTIKDIGKKLVLESTYANGKMYINDVTVA